MNTVFPQSSPLRCAILLAILTAMPIHAFAQAYTFTDLGGGTARAINDAGDVVGNSDTGVAMLWDNGVATPLASAGHWNVGTGINDSGMISGFTTPYYYRPAYYGLDWASAGSSATMLPGGMASYSIGMDVNNSGTVAGYVYNGLRRPEDQAAIWTNGTETLLGAVSGAPFSKANSINNAGQAVGYAYSNLHPNFRTAVEWINGAATILHGSAANASTDAMAISNSGLVAGYMNTPGLQQAVVWNNGQLNVLGSLGGKSSAAYDVNDAGAVVGYSHIAGSNVEQATLWENGQAINLNSYLTKAEVADGWVLEQANAINDNGTIVGIADNTVSGKQFAFELNVVTAVPEPGNVSLWLTGLITMTGFTLLRRQRVLARTPTGTR